MPVKGGVGLKNKLESKTREKKIAPTPSARVGVIYGGIDVAEVYFSHKTIYLLRKLTQSFREEEPHTFSCREKLAKRDWR
jgi:hypothetical protein